jgi:hypothetical protein
VVALFPTSEWAIKLNEWRWSAIFKLVRLFTDPEDEHPFYTFIDGARQNFVLEEHVGTRKVFVNSGLISLNCSTTVESDVDITVDSDSTEFIPIAREWLREVTTETDEGELPDDRILKALTAMFDVELFFVDHSFTGDNAVLDENGQLVPVMSKDSWYLSQRRLSTAMKKLTVLYPVTDIYRELPDTSGLPGKVNPGDPENLYRLSSDGYYTRPAFMYVADPDSPAHNNVNIEDKSNIEVVRNSYRALMMVVFENLGFALEYVDPGKHGICPTVQSRAKKIAKYAGRVSQALSDVNVICRPYGVPEAFRFEWWNVAGKGRDPSAGSEAIRTAFKLDPAGSLSMFENPRLLRDHIEKEIVALVRDIKVSYSFISNIKRLRGVGGNQNIRGGGSATSLTWANIFALVSVTLLTSFVGAIR